MIVIGAGSWGTALACAAARKNPDKQIVLYARSPELVIEINTKHTNSKYLGAIALPKNIVATNDLHVAISNNLDVLLAVPSSVFQATLLEIVPSLTKQHNLLWATKGLESTTGKFLSTVVQHVIPDIPAGIISGPSFAKEVAQNLPTAIVLASKNDLFVTRWKHLLHHKTFRVYESQDLNGVQLSGVMKNILAVAAGICDGLELGANARAALISRGMTELSRLAKHFDVSPNTLLGLAGLGDIVLTCTDNQSRNKRFGALLAQGCTIQQAKDQIGQIIEALANAKALLLLAEQCNEMMPITEQVFLVLTNDVTPSSAVNNLLERSYAV